MPGRSRAVRATALAAVAALAFSAAVAADWPGWLGPSRDGASPEKDVFGAGEAVPALVVAWNRPLGRAYSGIAVAEGRAVTMFADGEIDWLIALDASSGEELWRYRIDRMFPRIGRSHGGPLSMPVVDDNIVYGLGARGQLFAVKLDDGSEVWSLRVDEDLGARRPHFGFATVPLVAGDLLFVQTGGSDGHSLTGLDKRTGKHLWSAGHETVGYQSPILTELGGRKQIVAVTNQSVMGLLPGDGTVLWQRRHGLVDRRDGWSTPIRFGEESFVLTGGAESAAFRVNESGGVFTVKERWRTIGLKGNFAMPVAHGGYLYGYSGKFLACVDAATGKRIWKHREDGAGLILVDAHLVIFGSDGAVIVAEASPEGYAERAQVQVAEMAGFTYPSFSNRGIFVRNLESIARVDIRAVHR